jgi:hypothetical protein
MTMRRARVVLAFAVVGAVGFTFQGSGKDELTKGAAVRVASKSLSAGWHEGTVTTVAASQSKNCFGVDIKMPNSKTGHAVVLFDGIDSIDVRGKQSAADSAAKKPASWTRLDAKALNAKYGGCKKAP